MVKLLGCSGLTEPICSLDYDIVALLRPLHLTNWYAPEVILRIYP